MKSFSLLLKYLILTHIWEYWLTILIASLVSFFSEEPWISNSSLVIEKLFSGALFPWERDKVNLNKQTRKGYFILLSFNVQSFSRYRTNFPISQLLASSMLPTSVIPAITNAFSQYETFCLVFIGSTSFSFRYASSGMISVWYNLYSDFTLSQTSSDNKILSTVGKTFANTLLKALDIWSVRLEIPPNAFVSLGFNGCMYEQLSSYEQQCLCMMISNSVEILFLLHTYQVHLMQQTCFLLLCLSRNFKDLKYFLSLTSINKGLVADTLVLFPFKRLYILIW